MSYAVRRIPGLARRLWLWSRLFGAALLVSTAIVSTCTAQMLVVLSDAAPTYREIADAFREGIAPLRGGKLKTTLVSVQEVRGGSESLLSGFELVVTVGLSAAEAVLEQERKLSVAPPTLCLLIPRQSFDALAKSTATGRERALSAVYIDQPLSRQFNLIRAALPERTRLGAVLGPSSGALRDELIARARERDLALSLAEATEASGVYAALQKVMPRSDMLLALPDPIAFNATTAYGIMLTSYRAQVPVIGFSEGLVKAGALLGLFSTPQQLGRQGAEIAARFLDGEGRLAAPQYPKYFTVRVNTSVARSLGIRLESEEALAAALERTAAAARDSTAGKTP